MLLNLLPPPVAKRIFSFARRMIFTLDEGDQLYFFLISWNPNCQTVFSSRMYESREAAIKGIAEAFDEISRQAVTDGAAKDQTLTPELREWILGKFRDGKKQVIADDYLKG